MTLYVYPHEKIFKERQQSTLDQQLTSVRNIGIHVKQIHIYEFI
jgi:hypothetical protein